MKSADLRRSAVLRRSAKLSRSADLRSAELRSAYLSRSTDLLERRPVESGPRRVWEGRRVILVRVREGI